MPLLWDDEASKLGQPADPKPWNLQFWAESCGWHRALKMISPVPNSEQLLPELCLVLSTQLWPFPQKSMGPGAMPNYVLGKQEHLLGPLFSELCTPRL